MKFFLVILYFVFLITDLSAAELNVGMFNKLNGKKLQQKTKFKLESISVLLSLMIYT